MRTPRSLYHQPRDNDRKNDQPCICRQCRTSHHHTTCTKSLIHTTVSNHCYTNKIASFPLTGRNLLPYLSAGENVAAALAIAGAKHARAGHAARVETLLELLGVGHCADRRPGEMSGGEQQRVAIAVALANEPRVLLADEPTGELDDATSAHVLEAMREVNRELGVTTLIVTHDPAVSEHVARTVQIRDGRTSTEVLRSTRTDEHGAQHVVADEYAVLDRVGRMQLPDEFVASLGLRDRVRLALEPDHVGVWPAPANEPKRGESK